MKDDLDPERITRVVAERGAPIGAPLLIVARTGSTNDDAKAAARAGAPSGSAFLAEEQTGGRGRMGRVWHSPPGQNLYASFVLRPWSDRVSLARPTVSSGDGLATRGSSGASSRDSSSCRSGSTVIS